MDPKESKRVDFSLFGPYNSIDNKNNVPVYATSGANAISPYLNFNPQILNPNGSKFILPEGQKERRGRLELMFFTIGGSVIAGSFMGSIAGLYRGLCETKDLRGPVRTSSIINYVGRQGATTATAVGSIALIYSLTGTAISYGRGVDDELNTLASGTLAGLIYRSTSGLQSAARGGLAGLAIAGLGVLVTSKDRLKQYM
ncbi:unnamed protein product [Didymodactylos carnosus]|uniref:Mitochondrial import inner membrane translocase subunit TIM23 n=1 Tax=Didymodactylos carnosus TaxID=1234261 RepID=A0A814DJ92_9BILA|nr:unnamed protein product [Didymodactylos carnosus]CAF1133991.1 unnamed protein product [Didymodactylos carnosus]CAF3731533.1 unnamed protein product [Didymodactylos carnosus]CAF3920730.1 unnamed protein product [Didymodactylos carnosus]